MSVHEISYDANKDIVWFEAGLMGRQATPQTEISCHGAIKFGMDMHGPHDIH